MNPAILPLIWILTAPSPAGITYSNCIQDMRCEQRDTVDRKLIKSITATSTLKDQQNRYEAENLLDDHEATAWCEGKPSDGAGESVTIEFKQPVNLGGFYFSPMYAKSFKTARQNNRVKKFTIIVDVTSHSVTVDRFEHNECGPGPMACPELTRPQAVFFPGGRSVKKITIRIDKVEKGTKYNDTCISTLHPFPHTPDPP
jgi:hypothetical protein